jgi:hypothetical protein
MSLSPQTQKHKKTALSRVKPPTAAQKAVATDFAPIDGAVSLCYPQAGDKRFRGAETPLFE